MPIVKRLELPDFNALGKGIEELLQRLPTIAGVVAVNFFQDRFNEGGWIDNSGFERWDDRKDPNANGSALLVSGFLKNAFDTKTGKGWVEITNYAKYSATHNEGGIITIKVTKKARRYFWYMYKKTNDIRWKHMAITKKETFTMNIPKRQFMGHSAYLLERLDLNYKVQLNRLANKHF